MPLEFKNKWGLWKILTTSISPETSIMYRILQGTPRLERARERLKGVEFIYFDIDGTLWNHHRAEERGLRAICEEFGWEADPFVQHFREVNRECWRAYCEGRMTHDELKVHRFREPLRRLGYEPSLPSIHHYSQRYLSCYIEQPQPMDGVEVLTELADHFGIGVLTNGISRMQAAKLMHLRIDHLIEPMICSDLAPAPKPSLAAFAHAQQLAQVPADRIVIVGDDPMADIHGGHRAGWRTIWVCEFIGGRDSPEISSGTGSGLNGMGYGFGAGTPTAAITHLHDLRALLLPCDEAPVATTPA